MKKGASNRFGVSRRIDGASKTVIEIAIRNTTQKEDDDTFENEELPF